MQRDNTINSVPIRKLRPIEEEGEEKQRDTKINIFMR